MTGPYDKSDTQCQPCDRFTPERWQVSPSFDCTGDVELVSNGHRIPIAFIRNWRNPESIRRANLIAAAPKMYRKLQEAHSIFGAMNFGWARKLTREIDTLLTEAKGNL